MLLAEVLLLVQLPLLARCQRPALVLLVLLHLLLYQQGPGEHMLCSHRRKGRRTGCSAEDASVSKMGSNDGSHLTEAHLLLVIWGAHGVLQAWHVGNFLTGKSAPQLTQTKPHALESSTKHALTLRISWMQLVGCFQVAVGSSPAVAPAPMREPRASQYKRSV
jgi:hypothetical protein